MWCLKLITLCTCVVLLSSGVVHGKYVYQSDVQRSIGQNKVVATWEEAKKHCEDAGALLASPTDKKLLKHMLSYIDVNNHTNPYFIGIKAKYNPQPEFYSAEGVLLDDLPEVVLGMIDQLDPRDGDCLAMNRDSIRVVPCWNRYPYICYTKLKSNEPEAEKTVKPTAAASTTESTTKVSPTTESTTKVSPTTESTTKVSPTTESTAKNTTTTEIVTETTTAPECDEGYKYYPITGTCYHLHTTEKSWINAKKTCEDEGGHLAIINDSLDETMLANIIIMNYGNLGSLWVELIDNFGVHDYVRMTPSIHDIDKTYQRLYVESSRCGVIMVNDEKLIHGPCFKELFTHKSERAFVCKKNL